MFLNQASKLIHLYHEVLCADPLWAAMENTVEDSPWHRERNVKVHTSMVFNNYMSIHNRGDFDCLKYGKERCLGALACAFHDTGKPAAEETIDHPDRGTYRRYTGHEMLSAREWESWACDNFSTLQSYVDHFTVDDIVKVSFLIEHHLPYGLKGSKQKNLFYTLNHFFQDPSVMWNCIRSDCTGRMSDDHEQKIKDTEKWLFAAEEESDLSIRDEVEATRVCYIPVASSGSGKSTFVKNLGDDVAVHSMDLLRLDMYGEKDVDPANREAMARNYTNAFNAQIEDDSNFKKAVQADFIMKVKDPDTKTLVIDNVNLSRKRRAFYVTEARKKGFKVVAVLFPVSRDTVLDRQITRGDKQIPVTAVYNQYSRLQIPLIGEVDDIMIYTGNEKTYK